MGMTIDEIIQELESTKDYPASDPASDEALDGAIDTMHKYQLMQADYEKRLKADMMAMLTELQLEIDEIPINADNSEPFKLGQASAYDKCENLIYQKIDTLKAESEGK